MAVDLKQTTSCAVSYSGLASDLGQPVVLGMVLFGFGFGMLQSSTMSLMLSRVSPASYGTVSAVWNMAYDFGYGVGPMGFGVLAASTGYPAAFGVTAAVMLTALAPARRVRR